ncbi:MAG: bifunctional phosphopantothenoylcysteine decarboxylase/phosphopantothenate--cysteine ligase CoaBC [Streptosporangiaceae bacterium]|nr:bifunctional phosphopantothenoylcysteine decarboxylase/phosphopantothenate--cysteine ligase CoaBC [Streptosporangiaceae bacterium]
MPARVVLGVGAGIAAYKACELLRLLTESGSRVRVVPTADALRFVGEVTWAALSGEPVTTQPWTGVEDVPHVRLGQEADLVVVAPATADLMARAAAGMADDLLTATLLTARCPVLFAPAMHTEMWEHPATQANVALLRHRGAIVLDPAVGRLTGKDSGAGRLPEPAEIFALATHLLTRGHPGTRPARDNDLAGRRVVVSAGGTREEIDPVRFIGNWSSGLQGYALARTAIARGAEVTLVAANVSLSDPAGAKVVRVTSAREMHDAVMAAAATAAAVVMAAAVADYRPATRHQAKLKKDGTGQAPEPIHLVENPDILAALATRRTAASKTGNEQVLVGFAAETDTSPQAAKAKLARKGCDLLVVNPVGNGLGFGTADNEAVVYRADGSVTEIPRGPKEALADVVWDLVACNLKLSVTPVNPDKIHRKLPGLIEGVSTWRVVCSHLSR